MNVEKLPKWAQTYIRDIERQRETAIDALNEHLDAQTESPFYIDELVCTGEDNSPCTKRRYVQTYKISVEHQGVNLDVLLRDDCITISWSNGKYSLSDVAFIPATYQQARLVSKENMR